MAVREAAPLISKKGGFQTGINWYRQWRWWPKSSGQWWLLDFRWINLYKLVERNKLRWSPQITQTFLERSLYGYFGTFKSSNPKGLEAGRNIMNNEVVNGVWAINSIFTGLLAQTLLVSCIYGKYHTFTTQLKTSNEALRRFLSLRWHLSARACGRCANHTWSVLVLPHSWSTLSSSVCQARARACGRYDFGNSATLSSPQ